MYNGFGDEQLQVKTLFSFWKYIFGIKIMTMELVISKHQKTNRINWVNCKQHRQPKQTYGTKQSISPFRTMIEAINKRGYRGLMFHEKRVERGRLTTLKKGFVYFGSRVSFRLFLLHFLSKYWSSKKKIIYLTSSSKDVKPFKVSLILIALPVKLN